MEFLIITGMSGAGKSQAANTLEDLGWYCIDNMPSMLIPRFAEIYSSTPEKLNKVAFIVDIRGEVEFNTLFSELKNLRAQGFNCRTIFLECSDEVIINRYKFTRRTHPMVSAKNISISDALKAERELLAVAKENADYTIVTTNLTNVQLKEKICGVVNTGTTKELLITCMSFGFKHGAAGEADLVFDVRCFPNPYYHDELRSLTGLDSAVRDFVFSHKETTDFTDKLYDMVDFLLPLYLREGKSQLIVAIGCTGGKHRSVAIAEALSAHFRVSGFKTVTIHRDITK